MAACDSRSIECGLIGQRLESHFLKERLFKSADTNMDTCLKVIWVAVPHLCNEDWDGGWFSCILDSFVCWCLSVDRFVLRSAATELQEQHQWVRDHMLKPVLETYGLQTQCQLALANTRQVTAESTCLDQRLAELWQNTFETVWKRIQQPKTFGHMLKELLYNFIPSKESHNLAVDLHLGKDTDNVGQTIRDAISLRKELSAARNNSSYNLAEKRDHILDTLDELGTLVSAAKECQFDLRHEGRPDLAATAAQEIINAVMDLSNDIITHCKSLGWWSIESELL